MQKAVGYIRVGPLETRKRPYRRADQEKLIRAYCKEQGLDIMLMILDTRVEAFIPLEERLGGRDLINMVVSKSLKHVVFWRLNRLFRSAAEILAFMGTWSEHGVVFHILDLDGMSIRTDQEAGRIVEGTLKELSDIAHDLPAERTKNAIRLKKNNRFVYGVTPYGYDHEGNQLIANPEEQEVIRLVKSWRSEGKSLRKIADALNEMSVPTKRAKRLARETRWYASTVRYLLQNEIYLAEDESKGRK